MDTNQYLEMFLDESIEHLQTCNEYLLELEKNPEDLSIVNEIFRSAHTLKGMSATMGYEDIANLTHIMENVLDAIRNESLFVTPEILDVVFEAVGHLDEMVHDIEAGGTGEKDVTEVVAKLNRIAAGEPIDGKDAETAATTDEQLTKTVLTYDDFEMTVIEQSIEQGFHAFEIEVELREDCLLKAARVYMVFEILEQIGDVVKSMPAVEQLEAEAFEHDFTVVVITTEEAEEIQAKVSKVSEVECVTVNEVSLKVAQEEKREQEIEHVKQEETNKNKQQEQNKQQSQEKPKKSKKKSAQASSRTIRVNIERLDVLMNLFEELMIDRGRLQSISTDLRNAELTETVERFTRVSGDLQNIILNMRMVPVETVFNRFPTMVRQLVRELNKKVNLEIVGAETELDRTVIDEIGDPLVHLIRNALDHGIEMPEERVANGKPEEGTVRLSAYHSGNHVFIELEDDGAGINREKVLNKAISNGLVSEEEASTLTDQQVAQFILASGFSTAEVISDVSGRGVGLDVVRTTIESLGGHISIESKEGSGSLFRIQLPLTLSIISVMLVQLREEVYAVPLSSIIETAIIHKDEIMQAHSQKVIDFRGNVIPLVDLQEIFECPEKADEDYHSIVIVRKGDKLAGLVVDSFIGQQEIVLKGLGNYLTNVFAISGATILGDGKVALIVDCNALIK
ncbi:MAG TPA: chemotaxis protein CheA [Sporosarcina sp.]|nr:chemotaxis protein CheA [Sporosarcina sp.]